MKHSLSLFLSALLCFGVMLSAFATVEDSEGYTPVYTAEDLDNIRNNLSGSYILMNDIDLSGYENWTPIGTKEAPFAGTLDGKNHSIDNLRIHKTLNPENTHNVGLFGYVSGGTLKNITMTGVDIDVHWKGITESDYKFYAAALAAKSSKSDISCCAVSGNISVNGFERCYVGGIAGEVSSSIDNCFNYADVTVTVDGSAKFACVGGVLGKESATVNRCGNFGTVALKGQAENGFFYVGGVIGESNSLFWAIRDLYNRGKVYIETNHGYVGGIAGCCSTIVCAYNTGDVVTPEEFTGCAGGIAGNIYNNFVIGVPGFDYALLMDCHFIDSAETPASLDGVSYDNLSEDEKERTFRNVKRVTAEEMRQRDLYEVSNCIGFNFDTVWVMEEDGYPVIQNQPTLYTEKKIELEKGETYTAGISSPWVSSDQNIASVDENGNISAINAGTAIIAVCTDYGHYVEYAVTVTDSSIVPNPEPEPDPEPEPEPELKCPLLWIVNLIKKILSFVVNTVKSIF